LPSACFWGDWEFTPSLLPSPPPPGKNKYYKNKTQKTQLYGKLIGAMDKQPVITFHVLARKLRSLCFILFKEKKGAIILRRMIKPLMLSKYGNIIRNIIPTLRPWCMMFPRIIVILSDGSVTTCCFDPYGRNRLGSVYEKDITEIWNTKIKDMTREGLYELPRCRECIGSQVVSLLSKKRDYLEWQNYVHRYPQCIQLEVTGRCNYGCCCANELYKHRKNNETKLDLNRTFENIKSFFPKITTLNLSSVGESLLHEGFCDFVKKCRKESDSLVMMLATNGLLMDEKIARCLIEEKVYRVNISIHGGPGTENMLKYSKYGADYNKVLANIKRLTELRRVYKSNLPYIAIKTILFNWNDSDDLMDTLRRDAKAVGVDRISWTLDCGSGYLPRSSKRFTPGSNALRELQQRDIYVQSPSPTLDDCT
jgi:radical SAM protein with 4Fe4S-binding SPASM domain